MTAEYLDRSSLVARMKYYEEHTTEESGEHYAYSVALREIRNAPAADVAEVVHGQWLTHYRSGVTAAAGFVSSCCDMWAERRSNYCPYCGAKMSGGEEIVRLVDLDAVIDRLEVEVGYEGMREDLYSLPVVDAVPVVRCKDCINYSGGMCFRCGQGHEVSVDADDFCSRGVTE